MKIKLIRQRFSYSDDFLCLFEKLGDVLWLINTSFIYITTNYNAKDVK